MITNFEQNEARLLALLASGVRTSHELQQLLDISQPTLSRLVSRLGGQVLIVGKSRATRYTRPRNVRDLGSEFPVFRIDEMGDAHQIGVLFAISNEHFWWEPLSGESGPFKSLPWFIADMRPDGFVGRAFVQRQRQVLSLPSRLQDWSEDHVLIALARRGEDCMGNLIIGTESLERYFQSTRLEIPPLRPEELHSEYPRLAQSALDGDPVGSSAGGEQPKFAALIEKDRTLQNVLVKFSSSVTTEEGRRWADLLVCEHHALQIIQEAGITSAQSRILTAGDRVFLEVVRFDRIGRFGRQPIISLGAVDAEFYGDRDNWIAAANRLEADKRISQEDATSLRWLSVFGSLIANTDQHFGNVSLLMRDGQRRFELAPAYDVLPMYYRPRDNGVTFPKFNPPAPVAGASREWDTAIEWSVTFWSRASEDERISAAFRGVCAENRTRLLRITGVPRLVTNTR